MIVLQGETTVTPETEAEGTEPQQSKDKANELQHSAFDRFVHQLHFMLHVIITSACSAKAWFGFGSSEKDVEGESLFSDDSSGVPPPYAQKEVVYLGRLSSLHAPPARVSTDSTPAITLYRNMMDRI